jgi:hypothetical protein
MTNFYGQYVGFGAGGVAAGFVFQGSQFGYTVGAGNVIQRFPFTSDGDSVDVGDLAVAASLVSSQRSSTHGYASGGYTTAYDSKIQKFSFATGTEDAATIGDMTYVSSMTTGASSSTHGYVTGGYTTTGPPDETASDHIEKFPFASDGGSTDTTNLTQARYAGGSQSSETYGYHSGGGLIPGGSARVDTIDRWPFASDSDAADVGNLTVARRGCSSSNSTTYGYTAGGRPASNVIDKFSFASGTEDAGDVGNLSSTRHQFSGGSSSKTYGYVQGGGPPAVDIIEKYAFASDGDVADVGNLLGALAATSGNQY